MTGKDPRQRGPGTCCREVIKHAQRDAYKHKLDTHTKIVTIFLSQPSDWMFLRVFFPKFKCNDCSEEVNLLPKHSRLIWNTTSNNTAAHQGRARTDTPYWLCNFKCLFIRLHRKESISVQDLIIIPFNKSILCCLNELDIKYTTCRIEITAKRL